MLTVADDSSDPLATALALGIGNYGPSWFVVAVQVPASAALRAVARVMRGASPLWGAHAITLSHQGRHFLRGERLLASKHSVSSNSNISPRFNAFASLAEGVESNDSEGLTRKVGAQANGDGLIAGVQDIIDYLKSN